MLVVRAATSHSLAAMIRTILRSLPLLLAVGFASRDALSQPTPQTAPAKVPAPADTKTKTPAPATREAATQAPAAAASPLEQTAPPVPPPLEVSDPLLQPVPPASNILKNWREVLALINSRNVELRVLELEVARSEGLARQALARALPTITGTGNVEVQLLQKEVNFGGRLQELPQSPVASAQISLTQPILNLRTWHAAGTAQMNVKGAKLDADDKRRTVLAAVANAILTVVTSERSSEVRRVGLKSALERLELTQRRARLGAGTKLDVVRAEQDATLAKAQIVTGDQALLQARESLGLALGFSQPYGVPPSISLNELQQALKSMCSSGKPDERADVLAANNDVKLAERTVREAKLGFLPTADLSTSLNVSSVANFLTQQSVTWSVRGVLTVPIWDGGSRYGEVKAAQTALEQQKVRREGALRGAEIEVVQAVRAVTAAEQTRDLAEKARDLAKETARLSQIAFEAGTGTSFDLVEAGRREREAELDLTLKEFELIKAKITGLLATANCKY